MMQRVLWVVFLLLQALSAFTQNELGRSRKEVLADFLQKDSSFVVRFDSSFARLDVRIDGRYALRCSYFFDDEIDEEGLCDSMVIHYGCGPCFDRDLNSMLSYQYNDWLRMSDGRYITPRGRYQLRDQKGPRILALPMLTIERHEGEAICGVMWLSYFTLPKREAKALLKRLRCEKG